MDDAAKRELLAKAARRYKISKLRSLQGLYGEDVMDDVAIALNARPTRDEEKETEFWLNLFVDVGAIK